MYLIGCKTWHTMSGGSKVFIIMIEWSVHGGETTAEHRKPARIGEPWHLDTHYSNALFIQMKL